MKKRKQVRPDVQRKNQEKLHIRDIMAEVTKRTGYRHSDVTEVFRTALEVIVEALDSRKMVELPLIGMFYTVIQSPRTAMKMKKGSNKASKIEVPAKWVLRFRTGQYIKAKLAETIPTAEEVESIYID